MRKRSRAAAKQSQRARARHRGRRNPKVAAKDERGESPENGSVALTAADVLATHQLVKIYGGRSVVNGVDLTVREGEIVGLLGPNGAGKTTSFYMIVGLVRPNSGRVIFSGTDVTDFPMYRRGPLRRGCFPQGETIFFQKTWGEK